MKERAVRSRGMRVLQRAIGAVFVAALLGWGVAGRGQTCTTQAQMQAGDRDGLAGAAAGFAGKIQENDQAGIQAKTIADFRKDFAGIGDAVAATAPKLKGAHAEVEQIYLLDSSSMGKTPVDAQFICTLRGAQGDAEFTIPQLPPGRYGFAMVRMEGGGGGGASAPFRLTLLLRQEGAEWQLAGFYPKALTADGHDGLWYWKEARAMKTRRELWNAWLYLQEAQVLLQPANFVSSTHLEKLQTETGGALPATVPNGVSADAPLVVKAGDGSSYAFTSIGVDNTLGKVDVAAHLKVAQLGDATSARKRNVDAMGALLAAYPELRKAFHGVWIFAEVPAGAPYATEEAMNEIHPAR